MPPSSALPVPAATDASISWPEVLAGLDERRSTAFANGSADLLTEVYAAGSAPLARDAAALAELTDRGLRAVGLRLHIDDVSVVSANAESATLRVVDRLAPYRLVDSADAAVATEPGRGPVAWLVTVTPAEGGWHISEIARAP